MASARSFASVKMLMMSARVAGKTAAAPLVASAYDYADSAEHREGIAAFLDKRTPGF